jgi:D-serine deaminase-like pyridoxal phosphate-dependent protein
LLTKPEIPTPALLLDLDIFESNMKLMFDQVKRSGKNLRPHAKAHKCVEIARRQIAAGAIGVCVATVPEAELMTGAGIAGVLLTSPLGDPRKIARVVATGAMAAIDHVQQAAWYADAARAAVKKMDVLVDLDVGDHRTGAASIEQALDIARAAEGSGVLRVRGIQGYSARSAHGANAATRTQTSDACFAKALEARDAFARAGFSTEILTGGSTGTWNIDTLRPQVTELQAGSFVLMDLEYGKIGVPFQQALTLLATVVSANHEAFVTVDAGFKAFSADRPFGPEAVNLPGSVYRWGGDEFGYLDCPAGTRPRLGDRIEFVPPHCDPTVNLHDCIYACRGDRVEAVWPVMNRVS